MICHCHRLLTQYILDSHNQWVGLGGLSVHPAESLTHENLLKTLNYIMYMSGVDPSTVHFFDETSVVKTMPNQSYGHSIFQYEKPFAQAAN